MDQLWLGRKMNGSFFLLCSSFAGADSAKHSKISYRKAAICNLPNCIQDGKTFVVDNDGIMSVFNLGH